jgi:hypothetical protein
LKLTAAHPLVFLALAALATSVLLPAVVAAGTASGHAFIGSIEIRDPDGIHIHDIAPALVWPAFGLINFVSFFVVGTLVVVLRRGSGRERVNRTLLLFALVWCVVFGAIVGVQTARLG